MADYGVTTEGFVKKPKSVIVTEMENNFQASFGQDLDVSLESPEGQIIDIISTIAEGLWNVAEEAWNAFNPDATYGVSLENVAKINKLTRDAATATTVLVTFSGVVGTEIPEGTTISTAKLLDVESIKFDTNSTVYIGAGGTVDVLATCQDTGSIQVAAGTVVQIDVAIPDVDSVTNSTDGNIGKDAESDPTLRARRAVEVALPAVATTDAIAAGIQEIDTVVSTRVFENDTGSAAVVEGVNLDPHSIAVIVQGAETTEENAEIAQTIYNRKDPGIPMMGSVTGNIVDSQGFTKTMKWDTPTPVPVYINIVTEAERDKVSSDGQEIIDAIIAYSEDPEVGAVIGRDVYYARLFTPINSVEGHYVQSMTIGETASPTGTSDIEIGGSEIASFADARITVTVNYV